MKYSVVIPAKNEEKRLPASLAALCRFIVNESGIAQSEIEIIVVVNNSTDQTYSIVKIFQQYYKFIKVYDIKEAIGKGGAIKFGFDRARGEFISFIDADASSSAYELFKLLNALEIEPKKHIAIADRYSKHSEILGNIPLKRRIFSYGFRMISRILFRIKYNDTQCGLKAFRKEAGKYLMKNNDITGWTFDLNILIMADLLGLQVLSVPTVWEYKKDSTLNAKKAMRSVPVELARCFIKYLPWTYKRSAGNDFSGQLVNSDRY